MPDIKPPETLTDLPLTLIRNIVALSSSGFGVVVALAWNQVIQDFVKRYIDPYLGKDGGMLSLFIYAIGITVLAVVVTMQLTAAQRKLEQVQEKVVNRGKKGKEINET